MAAGRYGDWVGALLLLFGGAGLAPAGSLSPDEDAGNSGCAEADDAIDDAHCGALSGVVGYVENIVDLERYVRSFAFHDF